MKRPESISLVFPHQLFEQSVALQKSRPVYLIEDSLFFGDRHHPCSFHRQKIAYHRLTLAAYQEELVNSGFDVRRIAYDPVRTILDFLREWSSEGVREIHLVDPTDDILTRRLQRGAAQFKLKLHLVESPQFLTPVSVFQEYFKTQKRPRMAHFYQFQRQRLGLLVDAAGNPEGGQWSFDVENRKRLPSGLAIPELPVVRLEAASQEILREVEREFPQNPGSRAEWIYPVTRTQARRWLEHFLEWKFSAFGPYEDAIHSREGFLFHSVLTPMLNVGLLTPDEVVAQARRAGAEFRVPLPSLEGFIRQVIGWREFIRAMYEREGVRMRTTNFWGHRRRIPRVFVEGTTGIAPLDNTIHRVNRDAYCHHIERLMVLGSFLMMCEIDPNEVYLWFMERFIDAYDWVMVPNVYGMSQFADGGIFATKPYLSGSNYLLKMSDYPKGPWCETWDALFWRFLNQHRDFFLSQHRMSMLVRQWDRRPASEQNEKIRTAETFLNGLK